MQKQKTPLGIWLIGSVLVALMAFGYQETGTLTGAISFSRVRLQIPTTYDLYKTFFNALGKNVKLKALSNDQIAKYQPHYSNNLKEVRYGYASRIAQNWAITDCKTIYFGGSSGKGLVENLNANRPLAISHERWLLHELAHTEQCAKSGRKTYAENWFNQVKNTLIKTPSILKDPGSAIKTIHDQMPLEKAAESRAQEIMPKLGL